MSKRKAPATLPQRLAKSARVNAPITRSMTNVQASEGSSVSQASDYEQEELPDSEASDCEQDELPDSQASDCEQDELSDSEASDYEQEGPSVSQASDYEQEGPSVSQASDYEQEELSDSEASDYEQEGPSVSQASDHEQEELSDSEASDYEQEELSDSEASDYEQEGPSVSQASDHEQEELSDSEASDYEQEGPSISQARNKGGPTPNWKNHIPVTLYDNVAENPIAQCFCGFFGADGTSTKAAKHTGFTLRSTEFPFLYNLLKLVGVQEPRFYFLPKGMVSKTRNAAELGGVVWKVTNKELVKARAALGLPSSNIYSTDEKKARQFIFSLDQLALLRFILFWTAGDGHISFGRVENSPEKIYYQQLVITSRDVKILQIMKEALRLQGHSNCCTIRQAKGRELYRLSILHLEEPILDALDTIPPSIFHPKLKLLRAFLQSSDHRLPLSSHISSRLPFYDFIENNINDKLLLVLAQDFHSLRLQSVNDILLFIGLKPITSIADFNMIRFKEEVVRLEESGDLNSIFAAYLKTCRKRKLPDSAGPPLNFDPEKKYHNPCDLCPGLEFSSKRLLRLHQYKEHPKKKVDCKKPECKLTFNSTSDMKAHYSREHAARQNYHCNSCGKGYTTKKRLQFHIKTHSGNRQTFVCNHPGCGKSYSRQDGLHRHSKKHQTSAKRFYCGYQGCSYSSLRSDLLQSHQVNRNHY